MAGRAGKTRAVRSAGTARRLPVPDPSNYRPSTPRASQITRAPKPAKAPTPKPAPSSNANLGTTSTGTYAGYSGAPSNAASGAGFVGSSVADTPVASTPPEVEEPVKPPSIQDYLKSDKAYTTQMAALQAALKQFGADVGYVDEDGNWVNGLQGTTYQQDYDRNLRDLGWDSQNEAWNTNDPLTSYGSSYSNQIDDFAARGMLQSSAYQEALNNLLRGFNDQRANMGSARDSFFKDLRNQYDQANSQTQTGEEQAKIEALARRAAEYSL